MLQIFVKKIKEYFSVLYSALSEIVNREMAPTIPSEDTIKICEYCFLEILKLKDRVDQKETDTVVMSIYSRWTKVKNEIAKNRNADKCAAMARKPENQDAVEERRKRTK